MKRKKIVLTIVVLLVVGFASVSTTLVLNGIVGITSNEDDFNIIFTSAKLNNKKRNDFIEPNEKKILTFETDKLTMVDEEAILDYEVTNTSRLYDGEVVINCDIPDNEYILVNYEPKSMIIEAGKTKSGSITARLIKASSEDDKISIECKLSANALERNTLGEPYLEPFSKSGVLMALEWNSSEYLWKYKESITKVIFENQIIEHETSDDLIFDISDIHDGSVMAYLVANDEDTYTLYIQSDTGVKANRNSAGLFYGFSNLESIENLKYLDTSNVNNMGSMFQDCLSLKYLDLSDFNTSNVTNMGAMFYNCQSLESLDLANFDTSNVITMVGMFESCFSLNDLRVQSFSTSNVTNMSGMFHNCKKLSVLNLSSFDTSNVTTMLSMFEECNSLINLNLNNFNTSNVTNMAGMFQGCLNLVTLNIDNFDTSKVTNMSVMFYNCKKLTSLNVASFSTSTVTNMTAMFEYCSELSSLDISNFDVSQVESMDGIFHGCVALKTLDITSFDVDNIVDGASIFTSMSSFTTVKAKSDEVRDRILELSAADRPSAWNIDNIVV